MKKGDKISWNTSQGETHGELVEKKTKLISTSSLFRRTISST